MALQPQPGILEIAPYVGGESKAAGAQRVIRLASNENPLGFSAKAGEAFVETAAQLHRYPDGGAHVLRQAIADTEGLEKDRIVCGAGSDELIAFLIQSYAGVGDEVLYSEHSFLMYPIGALTNGATPVKAPEKGLKTDIDALLAAVTDRTRLVFVANPNNPTGSYLNEDELRRLHAGLRDDILLVLDDAYAEYVEAPDYVTGSDLVEEFDNVVMTRTFSKIHGLASLRIGWAYCPEAVADVLNRVRGPFNVNLSAQAAGAAAIRDRAFVVSSKEHNSRWKQWFNQQVGGLGLTVYPSEGNFVLIDFNDADKATAAVAYLKEQGILIRAMGGYGLAHCIRVTIGTEEDMRAVVEAIERFLGTLKD
ncbi:histidinol-phosphate transaminase [Kiloniella sp. b19]|uniref:histidinol-phosphate transaminase n=1 Tax=Kiloniella sp. GXU_MW_B19 TaxID=3141326 RepID=UPI0031E2124A